MDGAKKGTAVRHSRDNHKSVEKKEPRVARSESVIQRRKAEKDKENHYYLLTNQGEYKKTRWTVWNVKKVERELEDAKREEGELRKLLMELEEQYKNDKLRIQKAEQARLAVESKLHQEVRKVIICEKDSNGQRDFASHGVSVVIEPETTYEDFSSLCARKLKMRDEGCLCIYQGDVLIDSLDSVRNGAKLWVEVAFS